MLFPSNNNQVDVCEAYTCTSGYLDVLLMIAISYIKINGDSDICYSLLNSSSAKHILQIMTQCHRKFKIDKMTLIFPDTIYISGASTTIYQYIV